MMRTVPDSLGRARTLVAPALLRCTERLSPEVQRVVAYHLGFADAEGRRVEADGGKALRPALALLSAEAGGASAETGLPGAVAVELVHNFSLLHDDVIDHDGARRHRATAWSLFGVGPAIVAGDALLALAVHVLLETDVPARLEAASALSTATAAMIAGQGEDLAFQERTDVSPQDALRMCERKTGALLACASSIGAILAGAPPHVVRSLAEFGRRLGVAYQAIDDVLGIWGHPDVTGKPAGNDLRERKKSLPVAAALHRGGPGAAVLRSILSGHEVEGQVDRAAFLVDELGGRAWALRQADVQLERAFGALGGAGIAPFVRGELGEIATFVTERDR